MMEITRRNFIIALIVLNAWESTCRSGSEQSTHVDDGTDIQAIELHVITKRDATDELQQDYPSVDGSTFRASDPLDPSHAATPDEARPHNLFQSFETENEIFQPRVDAESTEATEANPESTSNQNAGTNVNNANDALENGNTINTYSAQYPYTETTDARNDYNGQSAQTGTQPHGYQTNGGTQESVVSRRVVLAGRGPDSSEAGNDDSSNYDTQRRHQSTQYESRYPSGSQYSSTGSRVSGGTGQSNQYSGYPQGTHANTRGYQTTRTEQRGPYYGGERYVDNNGHYIDEHGRHLDSTGRYYDISGRYSDATVIRTNTYQTSGSTINSRTRTGGATNRGYYDSNGRYVSRSRSGSGHYDSSGRFINGSRSSGGHHDSSGRYISGSGSSDGHYDSSGRYISGSGSSGGQYDSSGRYINGSGSSGGHYDSSSSGRYISGSGSSGGHYDSSGRYISGGQDGGRTAANMQSRPVDSYGGTQFYSSGSSYQTTYNPITSQISSDTNCPTANTHVTINGLTCSNAITQLGSFVCYNYERVSTECCERCLQVKRSENVGCEYGDRSAQCRNIQPYDCYNNRNSQVCCERCQQFREQRTQSSTAGCEYGDLTPRCQSIVQRPHLCYLPENQRICCDSCHRLAHREELDCQWGNQSPELCEPFDSDRRLKLNCYMQPVQEVCCSTCRSLRERMPDNVPGCEYGDSPVLFYSGQRTLDCSGYIRQYGIGNCDEPEISRKCCYTCYRYRRARG